MNKYLEKISFWGIFVFAVIGMLFSSVAIHEYSHMNDIKDIAINESICLNLPTNINYFTNFDEPAGFYSFQVNDSNENKYQELHKYTEWKAYAIGGAVTILFIVLFNMVLWRRWDVNSILDNYNKNLYKHL